jgi:hypothetical protein
MAAVRNRFQGTAEDIFEALKPVATSKSFIVYDESEKVEKARLDIEAIAKSHDVLSCLHALQVNMSFPKTIMEKAVAKLFDEKYKVWSMKPEHKDDWVVTITRRLRNIGRVVHQGCMETSAAAWVKGLPWRAVSFDPDDKPAAASASSAAAEYFYGWNEEILRAWRCKVGTKAKELSMPIVIPEGASADDVVEATWFDGMVYEVPNFTVSEFKAKSAGTVKPSAGVLWCDEHSISHNKLTLSQRVDRSLLLSLWEQSRQILQVRLDAFGPIGSQKQQLEESDPILLKALDFMKGIAVDYKTGKLQRSDLKKARDEALKKLLGDGVGKRRRVSKKTKDLGAPAASSGEHATGGLKRQATAKPGTMPVLKKPAAATTVKEEQAAKEEDDESADEGGEHASMKPPSAESEQGEDEEEEEEPQEEHEEEDPSDEESESEGFVAPSAMAIPACIEDDLYTCMVAGSLM